MGAYDVLSDDDLDAIGGGGPVVTGPIDLSFAKALVLGGTQ